MRISDWSSDVCSSDLRALGLQLLQYGDVGRIGAGLALPAALVTHFVEQDRAQLLRRSDGEGLAGQRVDFLLQRRDSGGELGGEAGERLAVDLEDRKSPRLNSSH